MVVRTMNEEGGRRKVPCARALFAFASETELELSFSAGVSIMLLRRIDENWLEGQLDGRVGIFPASHVKIELSSPSLTRDSALAGSGRPYAIALYSFSGAEAGDLCFGKGELIELLGPAGSGWMRGRISEHTGIFPSSFVEVLKDTVEHPIPKPRSRHTSAPQLVCRPSPGSVTREEHPTPTRSAPAPPSDSPASPKKMYSSRTLPKPKARQKLTRYASLSSTEQRLQSELAIELKMLESASSLLQVCHEAKRPKLQQAVQQHQANIEELNLKIEAAKGEGADAGQLVPTAPPRPAPPISQEQQQRSKVIDELIFTERDFHHQMQLTVSRVLPALQGVAELSPDVLFGNIEEVVLLSGSFLAALEACCRGDEAVGSVFVSFAPRLREVYAVYCRNHDAAVALIEKCQDSANLSEQIRSCLDLIRGETQAWDLQSLLIKPVQRVLKYPLLLERLVASTSDGHTDHKATLNARDAVAAMARHINEIKRRKDIVEKYTARDEKKGSVSMHSLQKKVWRFQTAFTQFTGLRSKTIDPKFDEMEQKVVSLEALLRSLLKDISVWQEELQHVLEGRETLAEGMLLYAPDVPALSDFQQLLPRLNDALKEQNRFIREHVSAPLEALLASFQDPLRLISKRRDKLLDYDHMQWALERAAADEVDKIRQLRESATLARRNYEALNTQLLEELPDFLELSAECTQHLLSVLVQAHLAFHRDASAILLSLLPPLLDGEDEDGSSMLRQQHALQVATVSQKLVQLSLVPASLAMNFTTPVKVRRASDLQSESSPTLLHAVVSPPLTNSTLHEQQHQQLTDEVLAEGSRLEVLYDFEAQDQAELSVSAGQYISLICPHDRIGCVEWWLVRTTSSQGYVPATYLAECTCSSSS